MPFDAHANLAYSTVTGAPGVAGTELEIVPAQQSLFPAPPFNMTVWPPAVAPTAANAEIVRVTNVTGMFTIVRAQEGTAAQNIQVGWQCAAGPTTKTMTDIESAVLANAAAIVTETGRAEAAEAANASAITAETSRAEAAEALLAPLASPALTGTPTAPTQTSSDASTKVATTAFVKTAVAAAGGGTVTSVAAGNGTITIGGTSAVPTVQVTAGTFDAAGAATAAVAAETARAEAAETTNANAITAETTRATTAEATKLTAANNLSDVPNAATARANLGLGSAATLASTAFDASGAAATAQSNAQTFASNALATALAGLAPAEYPAATSGSGLAHSGVGQVVGGITVTAGMRVLDTASAVSAGLWVAASGSWTRPTDFATGSNAQGKLVDVDGGQLWLCVASTTVTVDTTSQVWTELDASVIQAGSGLSKSGNTLSLALTKALVTATGLAYGDVGADASGAAAAVLATSLQKSNNLSDLASVSSARTSLGLGTAAVAVIDTTAGDFQANGTASAGSTGKVADAGHVHPTDTTRAPLASPALTGAPTAPTATALTSSTQLATTAYADSAVGVETTRAMAAEALKAALASPTFTGVPAAPTATPGTSSTQLATTAFVAAAVTTGGSDGVGTAIIDVTRSPYSMDPTGTTTDTSELQAALTACGNAGGGIVFLPRGTYKKSYSVSVPAGVILAGAGRNATVIQDTTDLGTGVGSIVTVADSASIKYPVVQDLTLQGPNWAGVSFSAGTSPNNMCGLFLGSLGHAYRVNSLGYHAGFVHVGNHEAMYDCRACGNYWGVWYANGVSTFGNQYYFKCEFTFNNHAGIAVDAANFIDGCGFYGVHIGWTPFGIYKTGYNSSYPQFLVESEFAPIWFESIGNAAIYDAGSTAASGGTQGSYIIGNHFSVLQCLRNATYNYSSAPSTYTLVAGEMAENTVTAVSAVGFQAGTTGVFAVTQAYNNKFLGSGQLLVNAMAGGTLLFNPSADVRGTYLWTQNGARCAFKLLSGVTIPNVGDVVYQANAYGAYGVAKDSASGSNVPAGVVAACGLSSISTPQWIPVAVEGPITVNAQSNLGSNVTVVCDTTNRGYAKVTDGVSPMLGQGYGTSTSAVTVFLNGLGADPGGAASALASSVTTALAAKAPLQETVTVDSASGSGTVAIPAPTTGTMNRLVLTGTPTLTFPTAAAGYSFTLQLVQDTTGSRTVTWPSSALAWTAGAAPVLATAVNKRDKFVFECIDGTNWEGSQVSVQGGY